MIMFSQGDVFWISSPESNVEHLHIIISIPDKDPQKIVVVPLTTYESWVEDTCVLRTGDHPVITHDTCVDYRRATILTAEKLDSALKKHQIRKAQKILPNILEQILSGASKTKSIPRDCDNILVSQGLID